MVSSVASVGVAEAAAEVAVETGGVEKEERGGSDTLLGAQLLECCQQQSS